MFPPMAPEEPLLDPMMEEDEALAVQPEPLEDLSAPITEPLPLEDVPEPEGEHFCDSDVAKWLSEVIEHLDKHDKFARDTQIKKWRKQMRLLGLHTIHMVVRFCIRLENARSD